jgi:hypothetical protein
MRKYVRMYVKILDSKAKRELFNNSSPCLCASIFLAVTFHAVISHLHLSTQRITTVMCIRLVKFREIRVVHAPDDVRTFYLNLIVSCQTS